MISQICGGIGFHTLRLDGSVVVKQRQTLVDKFNNEKNANNVFLLSTKAGSFHSFFLINIFQVVLV